MDLGGAKPRSTPPWKTRMPWHTLLPSPSDEVLPDIPHELGLQLLRTQFTANVQRALLLRDLLIPRTQVEHRDAEIGEGRPHEPPAIGAPFQGAAIRARATVVGIRHRQFRRTRVHQSALLTRPAACAPILAKHVRRKNPGPGREFICRASIFAESAGTSPNRRANPVRFGADPVPRATRHRPPGLPAARSCARS